jgi:hypothetical protein
MLHLIHKPSSFASSAEVWLGVDLQHIYLDIYVEIQKHEIYTHTHIHKHTHTHKPEIYIEISRPLLHSEKEKEKYY